MPRRAEAIEEQAKLRELRAIKELRQKAKQDHISLLETPTSYAFAPLGGNGEPIGPELALAARHQGAEATPINFNYTGAFDAFTVPTTGLYHVVAFGAQGGNGAAAVGWGPKPAAISA